MKSTPDHTKAVQHLARHNKAAMIEALKQTLGIVTTACKLVGIHKDTHYEWLKKDPEYFKAVEGVGDYVLDFAESQLHKQIKDGDIAATIFFLKTKGKSRGYIERQEIDSRILSQKQVTVKIIRDDGNSSEAGSTSQGTGDGIKAIEKI